MFVILIVAKQLRETSEECYTCCLIGFYDDDDIVAAKQTLFKFAESLAEKPDGMPRLIRRTVNDNKRKHDCDDMLSLYCCLDDAKVQLPTYAAVNLNRVPTISPGDVDIIAIGSNVSSMSMQIQSLASSVSELRGQVEAAVNLKDDVNTLRGEIQSVTALQDNMKCMNVGGEPAVSVVQQSLQDTVFPPRQCPQASSQHVLHHVVPPTEDTAASASNTGADFSTEWVTATARHRPSSRSTTVPGPRSTPMPAVRVKGSRENVPLKSVPRKQILTAFVGRLHSDTTEEELTKYLID